jgi:hypothetical protein
MKPRHIFSALVLLVSAWLLLPALTATHVEGLSAQLQSQSLVFNRGGISTHDPYLPLVTEFIFLKCPAVVDLLTWLQSTLGITGDSAFRVLTIASLVLLIVASVSFAVRQGGVGWIAALAAVTLTPGVAESGFFFNDNVVSAAFAALSLAILRPGAANWRYLASGLSIGLAVLSRLDGIFAMPLLLGVVSFERTAWPVSLRRLAALAAGLFIAMGISALINGASSIDSLLIYRYFSYARQIGLDLKANLFALAYFFGPVTPLLLLIGFMRHDQIGISTRRWPGIAFFCLYPILLCAFAVLTGREIRYLYPLLTPVIAMLGGRGVEFVVGQIRKPNGQPMVLTIVAAAVAVTLFVPPAVVSIADGPRMLVGRLWSPVLWRRWQDAVNESMSRVSGLALELDREPEPLVITTSWNGEFYVHLRIMELGYSSSTAAEDFPGCEGFSTYRKGDHRILHLRLHNEFYLVPYPHTIYGALSAGRAADCHAMSSVSNTWVTTFGSQGDKWLDPQLMGFGYERFPHPLERTFTRDWLRELLVHKVLPGPPWCCSDSLFDAVQISDRARGILFANAKAIADEAAREAYSTPEAMFRTMREASRGRTALTQNR